MDHYRFWLISIINNISNFAQSFILARSSILCSMSRFSRLCRTIMLSTSHYYIASFYNFFYYRQLFFDCLWLVQTLSYQQIYCCLSLNMFSNIYNRFLSKNIILYGGSLGSLFDEERSKVRESNANCRTHWAWITRTHLAAKT